MVSCWWCFNIPIVSRAGTPIPISTSNSDDSDLITSFQCSIFYFGCLQTAIALVIIVQSSPYVLLFYPVSSDQLRIEKRWKICRYKSNDNVRNIEAAMAAMITNNYEKFSLFWPYIYPSHDINSFMQFCVFVLRTKKGSDHSRIYHVWRIAPKQASSVTVVSNLIACVTRMNTSEKQSEDAFSKVNHTMYFYSELAYKQ